MRKKVVLACEVCYYRNYSTMKKTGQLHRLEVNKFCKTCNAHTVHRETK
jgi:large subunit ribosomal protein L33